MKKKRVLPLLFSMLMTLLLSVMCPAFSAFAAENDTYVNISVSADKESYKNGDKATFNVVVKNSGSQSINDLQIDASVSDNFNIVDNKKQNFEIGPNETKEYQISVEPMSAKHSADVKTDSPKTGDSIPVIPVVILAAALLIAVKTRKAKKVFSFIIAVTLFCSATCSNFKFISNAAAVSKKLAVETEFTYNNKKEKLNLNANYTIEEKTEDDIITINTSVFDGPNSHNFYNTDKVVNVLEGTLKNSSEMSSLKYEITDINDTVVLLGDITVEENWKAENFGLVVGTNFIKVTAAEKNGEVHEASIYVINICVENMNNTNVDTRDNDGDGLCNYYETIIGSDPDVLDTDGDGLSDYDEFKFTATDPSKADTDGNGISDADEDTDNDGLTNKEEVALGTNCFISDTDDDKLSDGDEVNVYGTDPLKPDTDGDGLSDSQEVELGYDPTKEDSDENGTVDSLEIKEQTKTLAVREDNPQAVSEVSVKLKCHGHIDNVVSINDTYNLDMRNSEVVGLVGSPFEFTSSEEFESAEITFKYNEEYLGSTDENDLRMLWYDEANDNYVPLDAVIDTENNTVTYVTTHFSTYLLVDKPVWIDAMRANINYRTTDTDNTTYYDMALVVDVSGSMYGERMDKAKTALNAFVDSMLPSDRAGLIKFNDYATKVADLTNDASSFKSSISSLSAYGGTYANAGLKNGIQMLKESGSPNVPIVILICDGDIWYDSSIISDAVANNITIFCINVVNGSSQVMERIASETGGVYYYAATNDDIVKAVSELKGDTVSSVDVTDTDNDGLYDVYEVNGMKLSNGKIVYTDKDSQNSVVDNATDSQAMGGAPVTETITIDGETISSVLWHAPVYNTLSPNYIYVDGKRNTNGIYNNEKLDYKPYSNTYYNRNYVNEVTSTYKSESRTVAGDDGVYNSFFDKLGDVGFWKLAEYAAIGTYTSIFIGLGIDGQAGYCLYEYVYGSGGPYEGLVPGRATRDYIYATFTIGTNLFGTNTANQYLLENMNDAVKAATSVLNDYNTDVYIALSPSCTWTGCFYNDCMPELSWAYAKQAIQTICNLPAFGIYNRADAGAVLHCTYDPKTQNYALEFNYYLIDYYDFTFYDMLDEMNKLGLARSYELYGATYGVTSWNKNDTGFCYWLF